MGLAETRKEMAPKKVGLGQGPAGWAHNQVGLGYR